jgi:protein KTI12
VHLLVTVAESLKSNPLIWSYKHTRRYQKMPSLILTGYPSAGKTSFAELLASRALSHKSSLIKTTVIINEANARPDKTLQECYFNSTEEKLTRSALKSEFDKFVKDPSKLVILDSMNYIKGFRYELHCISKSAGQKHGVVWTLCREQVAKAWNEQRSKSKQDYFYTQEMMDELIARYEPPDQRNRWDRPLWRVDVCST